MSDGEADGRMQPEKRTVVKSVQVNIFSDGYCGLNVSPGTTSAEAAAILHGALGVAMGRAIKEQAEGNGNGRRHLVVVPPGSIPKG